MKPEPLRIVIAGGGTGGHLFPAMAVAEAFRRRDPRSRILFLGTGRPLEKRQLARAGFEHRVIRAAGIKGQGVVRRTAAALQVLLGTAQSLVHLARFRPQVVIGVGGYSAGPVVLAAWLLHRRIVLHEQNVLPGLTNRLLARLADRICVSFEKSTGRFPADRVRVTGNPLREIFYRDMGATRGPGATPAEGTFALLITGGSQGARGVNRLVVEALDHLRHPRSMRFVHQTGPAEKEAVAAAYRTRQLTATVKAFFDDMPRRYAAADLVVCRAGATTVAELAAAGKPAVYIPYPFAADNHQLHNAMAMVEAGAGRVMEESAADGAMLARLVDELMEDRDALARMAARAAAQAHPEAAERIVAECCQLVAGG